jgi:hypothetical protein
MCVSSVVGVRICAAALCLHVHGTRVCLSVLQLLERFIIRVLERKFVFLTFSIFCDAVNNSILLLKQPLALPCADKPRPSAERMCRFK